MVPKKPSLARFAKVLFGWFQILKAPNAPQAPNGLIQKPKIPSRPKAPNARIFDPGVSFGIFFTKEMMPSNPTTPKIGIYSIIFILFIITVLF